MFIKYASIIVSFTLCIACDSSTNSADFQGSQSVLLDSGSSGESPLDSGEGFIFGVSETFSNNPLAIIDGKMLAQGESPRLNVLHNGTARLPYLQSNGTVVVTESCRAGGTGLAEYRQISALTADGGTRALSPCSNDIPSPSGFTWIRDGHLSPNGQRLVAQLDSSGDPPIVVIFEGGQEIERYSGYFSPRWLDDDNLVMVGSKLVTARLGEPTVAISDTVTANSLGNVAISPDGSRLAFEWQLGLWIINIDGTSLRNLLPANRYIFPAWSPDGRWIAAIHREPPSAFDAQLVGSGAVGEFFEFTNSPKLTLVHAQTGEEWYTDLSDYLNEGQMPQGGLSWY